MRAYRLTQISWLLSAAMLFTSAAQAYPTGKPMITHNPDGTFTVQKEPQNGNPKDARHKRGLVIPPQVVTPIFSTPDKK